MNLQNWKVFIIKNSNHDYFGQCKGGTQMLSQLPVNIVVVVKTTINRIFRRRKNLKMEILVVIISRHRRQVKRTEEHRDSRE